MIIDGVVALEADLEGIVPGVAEREILSAMVQEGDPTNKMSAQTAVIFPTPISKT